MQRKYRKSLKRKRQYFKGAVLTHTFVNSLAYPDWTRHFRLLGFPSWLLYLMLRTERILHSAPDYYLNFDLPRKLNPRFECASEGIRRKVPAVIKV
jgi:hypothetical protein